MAIEHNAITDPDIHEPKGAAAASSGAVYKTDGAGSGAWARQGYGCSTYTSDATAQTATSATVQEINATNFPLGTSSWLNNQASHGVTFNTTSGYFEVAEAGTYLINYHVSFSGDDASASDFQTTIGIDSGSGTVSKEANTTSYRGTTAAGLTGNLGGACMPTLAAGDKVYIMIRRNSGTADIQFKSANFVIHRV